MLDAPDSSTRPRMDSVLGHLEGSLGTNLVARKSDQLLTTPRSPSTENRAPSQTAAAPESPTRPRMDSTTLPRTDSPTRPRMDSTTRPSAPDLLTRPRMVSVSDSPRPRLASVVPAPGEEGGEAPGEGGQVQMPGAGLWV